WKVIDLQDGTDQKPPAGVLDMIKVTITDDQIIFDSLGKKQPVTFKIDPGKSPKEIDLTAVDGPKKGQIFRGYYSLDGDTLKLCVSEKLKDQRPKAMKADPDTGTAIMVLKKVKK
ncbi:MAG: TIGR03067 domain-containing protein, partial [Gemmataceae bacterium]